MRDLGGIPSWAVPGAKVVCVRSFRSRSQLARDLVPNPPIKGRRYTVERAEHCRLSGVPDVVLVEIDAVFEGERIGFDVRHFRPVVTRTQEQDLAIFAPLLGNRQPELERT